MRESNEAKNCFFSFVLTTKNPHIFLLTYIFMCVYEFFANVVSTFIHEFTYK